MRSPLAVLLAMALLTAACGDSSSGGSGASDASTPDGYTTGDGSTPPPATGWLTTKGNAILDGNGRRFHGKGANLPDQRGCDACLDNPDTAEEIRRIDELVSWGANFIRLGLESDQVKDNVSNDASYLADLKTVVAHAAKKKVYVLLSLWIDATLDDGTGLPTAATKQAWQVLAAAFANEPYALFGVVNEPHDSPDETVWKEMNETTQLIRDAEAKAGAPHQHIVVVQGTQGYARDTSYYVTHPITAGGGTNIAYETHPYNPRADYDKLVTTPAKSLPLIIGEFGPVNVGGSSVSIDGTPAVSVADCLALVDLAKKSEVPYLAFTFHMRCPPNLIVDHSNYSCGIGMQLEPTSDWGAPFKNLLQQPW